MSKTSNCPHCGARIGRDAPSRLCPNCLVKAGLVSEVQLDHQQGGIATGARSAYAPPEVNELASLFPQLEIMELLGTGGMGSVYKARQPGIDRLVAVKILRGDLSADPAFAQRFTREARAMARLSHPNIVSVYDFGNADGTFYFVMEYVDGTNLRQMIRTGELRPEEALAIVPQICDALQYAHDEGVVHRDIKPENILLNKNGQLKIADFGLAKLVGDDPADLLQTGTHQVMGTPRYMAPEQMEGSRNVDHRADIYSLGVVFYELLTGELPLGRFAPPSKKVRVDVRLDEVVLRTLEKEPERRYQHASEVKAGVEHASCPQERALTRPSPPVKRSEQTGSLGDLSDELEKKIYAFFESRPCQIVKIVVAALWNIALGWFATSMMMQIGSTMFGWYGMLAALALLVWSVTGLVTCLLDCYSLKSINGPPLGMAFRLLRYGLLIPAGIALFISCFVFPLQFGSFWFWLLITVAMAITWAGGERLANVWDRYRKGVGLPSLMDDPQWTAFDTGVICFATIGILTLLSNAFLPDISGSSRVFLISLGLTFWLTHLFIILFRVQKRYKLRVAASDNE